MTESIEAYDFAHAALDLYEFFWSELCDWYLEIVKPRLYDGDEDASATPALGARAGARARPPDDAVRHRGDLLLSAEPRPAEALVVHPFPEADEALIDEEAEREIGAGDRAHPRAAALARPGRGARSSRCSRREPMTRRPHELVSRLARVEFSEDGGEPIASVGGVELLETEGVDPEAGRGSDRGAAREAARRGEARRGQALQRGLRRQGPGRRGRRRAGEARRLPGGARGTGRIADRRPRRSCAGARSSAGSSGWSGCGGSARCSGMPQNRFASIHVVGTNGKTSVTRMTAALLEAHGVSDGRLRLAAHHLLARAGPDPRRADLGGGVRRGARAGRAGGRRSPTAPPATRGRSPSSSCSPRPPSSPSPRRACSTR